MSKSKSIAKHQPKSKAAIGGLHQHQKSQGQKTVARRNGRVEAYKALVRPIAAFYASCTPEPFDDLLQVGLMGLMRAAELYCLHNRAPFEAFAKPHVRGAILHYLRDSAQLIRLPRRVAELQQQAKRHREKESAALELTKCQRRALEEVRAWRPPISIDELPLDGITLATPSQDSHDTSGDDAAAIMDALQVLDSQSQWIVAKVVLDGWSYRRTASQLQVSPMTVQRRLKRGLARVKSALQQAEGSQGPSWLPARFAAAGC